MVLFEDLVSWEEAVLTVYKQQSHETGYHEPPPPGCPRAIYQLVIKCW